MSTVAAIRTAGFGYTPWVGLSPEAEYLCDEIGSPTEFSHSITIGEPKRKAEQALADVYFASQKEGTVAVEPTTYLYAQQFLQLLPTEVPVPDVDVDTDGEILFEWDLGPRRVMTVTVGRDGTLNHATLIGYTKIHGMEHLCETLPLVLSAAFERLFA